MYYDSIEYKSHFKLNQVTSMSTIFLLTCVLMHAHCQEERISNQEILFIQNGSLFNTNSVNTIKLLDDVQLFLFDNNRGIIFYKRNGTVYSSVNHQPATHTKPMFHVIVMAMVIVLLIIAIIVKTL